MGQESIIGGQLSFIPKLKTRQTFFAYIIFCADVRTVTLLVFSEL